MELFLGAVIAALPLAVWPGLSLPFSTPKLVLLSVAAGLALLGAGLSRLEESLPRAVLVTGLWAVTLVPSWALGPFATGRALWLELGAVLLLLGLLLAPPRVALLRWIAVSGAVVAIVTVLQGVGADPFRLAGLYGDHPGSRMNVFGTLGNPDFVAAFLGASLFLCFSWRRGWPLALLHLGALFVTRSFGAVLVVAAGGALFLSVAPMPSLRRRAAMLGALAALVVAGGLLLSAQRPLGSVIDGRLYLWRISAAHLAEAPVLGHGRGSFETLWLAWEAEAWRTQPESLDRRFAGIQDHVHNDYLEWALELGWMGALLRMALLVGTLAAAFRPRSWEAAAAGTALFALCVRGGFDFPFARPTELCVAVILIAWIWRRR